MEDKTGALASAKESARLNYNRLSRWYDLFAGSEKRFTELGLHLLNVQPGEQVLEVGFGTGQSLVALASAAGASGKVRGVDISEGMLQVAASRLQRVGLAGRVDLRLGDAAKLTHPGKSLDAIFMSFTLELFDLAEIPVVLRECSRVLRKNGRLGVVTLAKGSGGLLERLYAWGHDRYPRVLDCQPISARALIEAEGFHIIEAMQQSMWGLPVAIVIARKTGE